MKKPDLKGLNEEQNKYIQYLENCVFGASDLLAELNLISKALAEELASLRTEGTLLSNDENFDKVMSIIDKSPKLKALISFTRTEDEPEAKTVKKKNIQDFVLKNEKA